MIIFFKKFLIWTPVIFMGVSILYFINGNKGQESNLQLFFNITKEYKVEAFVQSKKKLFIKMEEERLCTEDILKCGLIYKKRIETEQQFSLKEISDEYELKLYNQLGNEVYSMMYPYSNKPYIEKVTESILEIGVYTGSPALNVFYFDKVSGETSIGYMNPIYVDGKYIAYMEQDKLIFAEIFNEEIYLEIIKEFSPAITPVTSIKMLDGETILVQYYTGENFIEVQEEISIKELMGLSQ